MGGGEEKLCLLLFFQLYDFHTFLSLVANNCGATLPLFPPFATTQYIVCHCT